MTTVKLFFPPNFTNLAGIAMEPISDADMQSILDMIPAEKPFQKTIDCVYSQATRDAIKVFKPIYISQTSSAARKQIFRSEILPHIFRHWRLIGQAPATSEESAARIKVLILMIFYCNNRYTYIYGIPATCFLVS